jgi:hypothetical protein
LVAFREAEPDHVQRKSYRELAMALLQLRNFRRITSEK